MAINEYLGYRASTALVVPDSSKIDDQVTFDEMNYVFNALRTLAAKIDAAAGTLSPLTSNWPSIPAISSVLGNNINKFYAPCAENIAFGAFVNFYALTGSTVQARNAQASSGARAAYGWCNTPGGFAAGTWGEFVVGTGVNIGLSGMTAGGTYFLSPTSVIGQVQLGAPSVAGQIRQPCGVAITDSILLVSTTGNWTQL